MNKLIATFGLFLCGLVPAIAQFEAASVLGTVRDKNDGIVQGAKIKLTNVDTGIVAETATDANGNFEFPTVRIGTYKVTAEAPGFSMAVASDIRVNVSSRQRVDLTMSVGQVSESVEVVSAAPLVETETSQRDQVVTHQAAVELPL